MYTVKQLSDLAGVSIRTLHYYDEIELLKPSSVGANGYRYYDDEALLRLQQILFYRDVGLELHPIKAILDDPQFDLLAALRTHRTVLQSRIDRLQNLMHTVDSTIDHLQGGSVMSKKRLFEGFSEEKQAYYQRIARLQYGPDSVNESIKRWNGYSPAQQAQAREDGGQVYSDLAAELEAGTPPDSEVVQTILARWHQWLRYFYEPTLDILRGLGETYHSDPDFAAFFRQFHPELPDYLSQAIHQYVDDLETAEIERLLAEDAAILRK